VLFNKNERALFNEQRSLLLDTSIERLRDNLINLSYLESETNAPRASISPATEAQSEELI